MRCVPGSYRISVPFSCQSSKVGSFGWQRCGLPGKALRPFLAATGKDVRYIPATGKDVRSIPATGEDVRSALVTGKAARSVSTIAKM